MTHSGTKIYMCNVPGRPDLRDLTAPLPYLKQNGTMALIPTSFRWNGATGFFLTHLVFPRHNHPIATCRHDYRCGKAKTKAERLFADREFEKDVGRTSWWITKKVGYAGVRIGDWLGLGWSNQYKKSTVTK